MAADMPAPVYKAAAPSFSWAGPYIGATVGWAWGKSQHCEQNACTDRFNMDGIVAGGTLGYNWQVGNPFVFGIELDASYANIRGTGATSAAFLCTGPCTTDVEWFGTARGRVGVSSGMLLSYVTGGAAFGGAKAAMTGFTSGRDTLVGWTAGGGFEYAFAPNWSAKVEYLYVDLGSFVYDSASFCGTNCSAEDNRFSVVRLGVNYRF